MKFKLLYNEYERFSHWTASRILNSVGFIERAKGFPLEYSRCFFKYWVSNGESKDTKREGTEGTGIFDAIRRGQKVS